MKIDISEIIYRKKDHTISIPTLGLTGEVVSSRGDLGHIYCRMITDAGETKYFCIENFFSNRTREKKIREKRKEDFDSMNKWFAESGECASKIYIDAQKILKEVLKDAINATEDCPITESEINGVVIQGRRYFEAYCPDGHDVFMKDGREFIMHGGEVILGL